MQKRAEPTEQIVWACSKYFGRKSPIIHSSSDFFLNFIDTDH